MTAQGGASTRAQAIARGIARLAKAGVPEPARDARLLYRWAGGIDGARFAAVLDNPAPAPELARFERAIAARAARTPVSHITGVREFWDRSFLVTPAVLDPRPETEALIAAALNGPAPARILDLGTGSGCVLLTLLAEWPASRGTGVDVSAEALAVAAANARRLGVADRAELRRGDWCGGLDGPFDLIVANPPYIAAAELAGLAPEVRLHEPLAALSPGGDGLDAYRCIAAGLPPLLAPGGRAFFEIGATQAAAVRAILRAAGLAVTAVLPDLDGRDRVISASP